VEIAGFASAIPSLGSRHDERGSRALRCVRDRRHGVLDPLVSAD
jgi:hypothetical protein